MIYQNIINDSITELYTNGGGKTYLTENYPTNYRHFWTRKVLGQGESADTYREATQQEKADYEALPPYVRPPQVFIDQWNAACRYRNEDGYVTVGRYNEATGYFELNGLLDITYQQAIEIMQAPPKWTNNGAFSEYACQYTNSAIRTHLPVDTKSNYGATLNGCFHASEVEVIDLPATRIKGAMSCRKLRSLRVTCILDACTQALPALEEFRYAGDGAGGRPRLNRYFNQSSKLSRQSAINLIEGEPDGDQAVTYTVHPDVYAKLTDAVNYPEWAAVTELATTKNIIFATT